MDGVTTMLRVFKETSRNLDERRDEGGIKGDADTRRETKPMWIEEMWTMEDMLCMEEQARPSSFHPHCTAVNVDS